MSYAIRRILLIIMPVVFLAASIFCIVMGFKNVGYQKSYLPVSGEITRIYRVDDGGDDYHFDVFVKYTVDGKEYESLLGEYSSSFREGAAIELKYDPADPVNVITAGGTSSTVLFAMGAVGILCALGLGLRAIRGY